MEKTMIRKLTLIAILVVGLMLVALPASAQDYTSYVVQQGDSLSKIALKFCTTWTEIYNINRQSIGDDPNDVEIGLHLTIPNRCGATHLPSHPPAQQVPPSTGGNIYDRGARPHATGSIVNNNIYAVAWGDTLFSIGQRFGPSVDQLRTANGLNEDSVLFASARIVIPGLNGVFATQLPLKPGEGAPVVGSTPSTERAFQIGECRIQVISSYPASLNPTGPVVTTVEAGTYGAARVSVIQGLHWFQIEYIDTLIWIADTVEQMNLGREGNCNP